MTEAGVPVLKSKTVTNFDDAKKAAEELRYPVIIRVAYTLGGRGGGIAHNEIELHEIVLILQRQTYNHKGQVQLQDELYCNTFF